MVDHSTEEWLDKIEDQLNYPGLRLLSENDSAAAQVQLHRDSGYSFVLLNKLGGSGFPLPPGSCSVFILRLQTKAVSKSPRETKPEPVMRQSLPYSW